MGLGGVAIAVPPCVIHPKTAVLGRAGGGILTTFFVLWNILVRNFSDFLNENPQFINILYINITKEDST